MIQEHEAKAGKPDLKLYRCPAGKLTIGYGRNIEGKPLTTAECKFLNVPTNLKKQHILLRTRGITFEQAEALFETDLREALMLAGLNTWFSRLDPVRQAVVVDMNYGLGPVRFKAFVGTRDALSRGDFAAAARCMRRSKWFHQTKLRARRLSIMMRTGQWVRREGPVRGGHWRRWE